jgi:signal transduction histidine kinase
MMRTRRHTDGLGPRLFASQVLIVVAGALTLVVVAVVVAPGLFRAHTHSMLGPMMSGQVTRDLSQALARTILVSLGIAVAAGLVTSLAVSWFITRRLTRPIHRMAALASRIADGDYDARVPPSGLGVEFATLDNAFNRMAVALQDTERRRRELLADLAHELRTPIATVESFLEGIEDEVIPAGPDTWRTMREQTRRLRRLVDDIDHVSRAAEHQLDLRPEPLDLAGAVQAAARAVSAGFAEKGVRLIHRHDTTARVTADPDRVREILDNLLGNALRHTPSGGVVTVSAVAGREGVEVSVSDTGEGIAAEHLSHVFDRFYRVDPARSRDTGGSGIGLTIARALARAHGGDLRAASDGLGAGATFTLTLPAAHSSPYNTH